MLTITFVVALDSQYVAHDGRSYGLVGKKSGQFASVDSNPLTVCTTVELLDGNDYRGDAIAGKKGERFVYFGLERSGTWLRRWKLRQQQLDSIFGAAVSDQITVFVFLGRDVTPTITKAS